MNKLIPLVVLLAGCQSGSDVMQHIRNDMAKPMGLNYHPNYIRPTDTYTWTADYLTHSMEPWISNGDRLRLDPSFPYEDLKCGMIVWRTQPNRMHMLQRRQGDMWVTGATGGVEQGPPTSGRGYWLYNVDDPPMNKDDYVGRVTILTHHGKLVTNSP